MKLINPTDDKLNEVFAEKIAGWVRIEKQDPQHADMWTNPNNPYKENFVKLSNGIYSCHGSNDGWPSFASSADAVMPWLEGFYVEAKYYAGIAGERPSWEISINLAEKTGKSGSKDCPNTYASFARVAIVALLRANGVEIGFD